MEKSDAYYKETGCAASGHEPGRCEAGGMIDAQGYRPNVGIILSNADGRVLWARRTARDGWQFPQGGVKSNETVEQALYRELHEEVGLSQPHVEVLGRTRDWLRYEIPTEFKRRSPNNAFRGQKQIWFLLRFLGNEQDVRLDLAHRPEFDSWRWIEYWSALDHIIGFKREVYRLALTELAPLLPTPPAAAQPTVKWNKPQR